MGGLIRNEKLRQLYAAMLQCRVLGERARLPGTQMRLPADYAAAVGHEAAVVGCTLDLRKKDVVVSYHQAATGKFDHDIPSRCKKTRNVVVVFSAPGDFSDGAWHEALSAAGAESLPILFVRLDQLAEETGNARPGNAGSRSTRFASRPAGVPRRAPECSFPRIPVDGHDVVAVYRVAHESIQRARRGGGATLIECGPYRLDSTGQNRRSNPAKRRTEIDPIVDPILSMERYLSHKGLFRDAWKKQLVEGFSRRLDVTEQE